MNDVHGQHHVNEKVNVGPDICDILFHTKAKGEKYEDTTHCIPNIIIAAFAVFWLKELDYKWIGCILAYVGIVAYIGLSIYLIQDIPIEKVTKRLVRARTL